MPLEFRSEQERSATLRRAAELAGAPQVDDIEMVLRAAEEAGIPRDALMQALRERDLAPVQDVKPGDMVFAPSADRCLYAAEVVRIDGIGASVRFVKGDEHTVAFSDLRPLGLVPGKTLECRWNHGGGLGDLWEGVTLDTYNPTDRTARVTSIWHGSKVVPLHKLRVPAPRPPRSASLSRVIWRTALAAGTVGTALGLLLGKMLL